MRKKLILISKKLIFALIIAHSIASVANTMNQPIQTGYSQFNNAQMEKIKLHFIGILEKVFQSGNNSLLLTVIKQEDPISKQNMLNFLVSLNNPNIINTFSDALKKSNATLNDKTNLIQPALTLARQLHDNEKVSINKISRKKIVTTLEMLLPQSSPTPQITSSSSESQTPSSSTTGNIEAQALAKIKDEIKKMSLSSKGANKLNSIMEKTYFKEYPLHALAQEHLVVTKGITEEQNVAITKMIAQQFPALLSKVDKTNGSKPVQYADKEDQPDLYNILKN